MRPTTDTCLTSVGARRCLARCAGWRGRVPWRVSTTCTISPVPGRPPYDGIAGPPGPAGRRSLTPTQGGCTAQPWQVEDPLLIRHPPPVGARRCLARRAGWRGTLPWRASTTCTMSPVPGRSPYDGIAGPTGPAGQAEPDPYRTGDTAPPPVGARRCLARRAGWRGDSAWPTRLARHASQISRAAVSTIARP
jgi:hypothetical protein